MSSAAVLFLDIDGVLNDNAWITAACAGQGTITRWSLDLARRCLDPARCERLQRACEATGADRRVLTLIYVDEEEFFDLGPDDKIPLHKQELSVEDAVAFSRSEEGMSTAYMEASCTTREEADAFSIACYMAGFGEPPTAHAQDDGTYSVFLWDELGK